MRRAEIQNPEPHLLVGNCKTSVTFQTSAGYPFTYSSITPIIDYTITFTFELVGKGQVRVGVSGSYNKFPDYEAYIGNRTIYNYYSSSSGPGPQPQLHAANGGGEYHSVC